MAETLKIPGIGPVKSQYVWAAGALVVGIVGYAYYKNSQSSEDYIGASEDDYGATDYDSPLGSSGGNSTVDVDNTAGLITTNSQWTQAAIDYLTTAGFDATSASIALGKYLARKPLSQTEIDAVVAARGGVGDPPVGGPYPITEGLPATPSTGTLPAPRNVWAPKIDRTWFDLRWDAVPGATGYNIYRSGVLFGTANTNFYAVTRQGPGGTYPMQVTAVNSNSESPKSATATVKTKK